jgi:uncharacterized protein
MEIVMRIGLISDTHIPEARKDLFEEVVDAFKGVDLILHGGDIIVGRVLDDLEKVAPVLAARGNHDEHIDDARVKQYHLLDLEGFSVALTHRFEPLDWPLERLIKYWLEGASPDIIVFGDTHYEMAEYRDGVLLVNPGSPVYPRNLSTRLGHIGFMELERGKEPQVEIVDLAEVYPAPTA